VRAADRRSRKRSHNRAAPGEPSGRRSHASPDPHPALARSSDADPGPPSSACAHARSGLSRAGAGASDHRRGARFAHRSSARLRRLATLATRPLRVSGKRWPRRSHVAWTGRPDRAVMAIAGPHERAGRRTRKSRQRAGTEDCDHAAVVCRCRTRVGPCGRYRSVGSRGSRYSEIRCAAGGSMFASTATT
jgi:hypothetical protein